MCCITMCCITTITTVTLAMLLDLEIIYCDDFLHVHSELFRAACEMYKN